MTNQFKVTFSEVSWLDLGRNSFVHFFFVCKVLQRMASDRMVIKIGSEITARECTALHDEVVAYQGTDEYLYRFAPIWDSSTFVALGNIPAKVVSKATHLAARYALSFYRLATAAVVNSEFLIGAGFVWSVQKLTNDHSPMEAFLASWSYGSKVKVARGNLRLGHGVRMFTLEIPISVSWLVSLFEPIILASGLAERPTGSRLVKLDLLQFPAHWNCVSLNKATVHDSEMKVVKVKPAAKSISKPKTHFPTSELLPLQDASAASGSTGDHGASDSDQLDSDLERELERVVFDGDLLGEGDADVRNDDDIRELSASIDDQGVIEENFVSPTLDSVESDINQAITLDPDNVDQIKIRVSDGRAAVQSALAVAADETHNVLLRTNMISLIEHNDDPIFVRWTEPEHRRARRITLTPQNKIVPIVAWRVANDFFPQAKLLIRDTGAIMYRVEKQLQPVMAEWCLLVQMQIQVHNFAGPTPSVSAKCCIVCDIVGGTLDGDVYVCYSCLNSWHPCCAALFGGVPAATPYVCPICRRHAIQNP